MPHPLKQRIGKLRSRVRLLLALHGMSWIAGAVLGAVLVLGLADYLVRFQDPGIRLLSSLAVLAVFGWTVYRYLYRPMAARLRDVDLARGLERRYPELEDSLASAVEFLEQAEDDPMAGSLALRRAVITKTTAETERLDFNQALQRRPVQRAALTATAIAILAMIVAAADPSASRIAVARLVHPFGHVAWPQRTHLMLRERIDRVARGQAFEIEVVDRYGASLPEQARIYYRFEDPAGRPAEESEPMHVLDKALVARRDHVTRPFSYRVEGGDDRSMPWIPVEVVDPPAVESLAIELTPPDYSGWPREQATGHVRALVGTRASFAGQSTKPLRSATLCLEDFSKVRGQVEADGRRFTIPTPGVAPWVIEKSGSYWFELTDTEALSGGSEPRWEVRAVPDHPPTATIEQPTATVFVTPEAVVPLRVAAKDDLAVARIDLAISRSDKQGESSLPLYAGPERARPRPSGPAGSGDQGENRVVTYAWQLVPLGLPPGTQVTFRATATDYKSQTGSSEPARLAVITREELAERIASRQAFILAELARVLQMQRESRQQTAALEVRAGQMERLDQSDIDRLRGAELNQRQVNRTLTSRSEGVPMHILGLLADLANNKVDSPDVQRRMEGLLDEIDRLGREPLPAVGRELTMAIKTAQIRLQDRTAAKEPAVAASLAAAGKHQDQVIASLEQMLGQLARWDNYRRFHRELAQLLRSQEELNRRTLELARRTLGKELRDLLPQELADLKVASREQFELARQLDRLLQEMDETARQLRTSDPLAAETVAAAVDRARELAIGSTMRSAGDGVGQNRMGEATNQQKQVVAGLQEIRRLAEKRRQDEAELAMEQLAQLHDTLKSVVGRQQRALEETRRLERFRQEQGELSQAQATSLFDLSREQKSLQAETQGLADDLAAAEVFHLVLGTAATEMGRAGALLDRRQTGAVTQQAEQAALESLGRLLEALQKDEPEPSNDSSGGGQQGGKPQAAHGAAIQNLAQLKLLRLLQHDLNRRTRELDDRLRAASSQPSEPGRAGPPKSPSEPGRVGPPSGAARPGSEKLRRQQAALSEEQGRLAALLMGLIQPEDEGEEEQP